MTSAHRRSPIRLAALLVIAASVMHLPAPGATAQEPVAAADGWFTNIASDTGLTGVVGMRNKLIDLNGDGWPDALITTNGADWRAAFLAAHDLTEIPLKGEKDRHITRDEWTSDKAAFDLYDFDKDGKLTQAEFVWASRANQQRLFLSQPADGGGRRLVEVTAVSGIRRNGDRTERGRDMNVSVAGDVDNDGDLDLFSGAYNDLLNPGNQNADLGDRACILLNDGTGAFTLFEQPVPATDDGSSGPQGPNAHPSTMCAACLVDVDNDGVLDLFTGSWYREYGKSYDSYADRLYRGLGDGRFADMTQAAGMMLDASPFDQLTEEEKRTGRVANNRRHVIGRKSHRPTYGVAHADIDNDGDQDLFVMAYGRQWNMQFRNNGDGSFTEMAEQSHFDGDDNEDGRYPEWVRRQPELPFRSNGNTFSCSFGDWNHDGYLDAVFGEITHGWAGPASDRSQILTNKGADEPGIFERGLQLPREHINDRAWNQGDMNITWADIDNDGYLDILLASSDYPDEQRLRIFRQNPATRAFEDVTSAAGLDWRSATQLSLADFDRDGDLDILVGNTHNRLPGEMRQGMPLQVALWRNDIANRKGHHFLSLRLQGAGPDANGANRSAIGARIIVTAGGLTQIREINGGHGHVGQQSDFRQIIGLGATETIDRLEIRWPGRAKRVSVFENVKADQFLLAVEGEDALREDAPRSSSLPSESDQY